VAPVQGKSSHDSGIDRCHLPEPCFGLDCDSLSNYKGTSNFFQNMHNLKLNAIKKMILSGELITKQEQVVFFGLMTMKINSLRLRGKIILKLLKPTFGMKSTFTQGCTETGASQKLLGLGHFKGADLGGKIS